MDIFNRTEQKYLLNSNQYQELKSTIKDIVNKDNYYKTTILNIYYDNDSFELINNSLEKPLYKEKVRIRKYKDYDNAYLEIKKKYKGNVNKRRITFKVNDIDNYKNDLPVLKDNQIYKEIIYTIKKRQLKEKIFIAYDRISYYLKENQDVRITFDSNLRYRLNNLSSLNDGGNKYFKEQMYIMEIKTPTSLPIGLCKILSNLKIYPCSFSKYGKIYEKLQKEGTV